MEYRKIIVTGHQGYIGAHLVKMLINTGYDVLGIDTAFFDKDCEFYNSDINIDELKKDIRLVDEKDITGAYAICHLAGLSNDPLGELNTGLTYDINHKASVRLARLAKKVGIERFIFSSSCSMYGIANNDVPVREESPLNPITAYARSKAMTENDLVTLADKDFTVTILRNATAFGISQKLRLDLVVNNLVGWAITTGEIRIMSDGTPWRPLIHAEDIARAFVAALKAPQDKVNGIAFNTGTNENNYQVKEIAETICETLKGSRIRYTGEQGSDSRSYRVDFTKIFTELPEFRPVFDLRSGIAQLYEYYQKYSMDHEKFTGRYFTRLRQLNYLIEHKKVDANLFWL